MEMPMSREDVVLRFGDMTDEVYQPALLVWGNQDGLLRFRNFLRDLPPGGECRSLADIPGCLSVDRTMLIASIRTTEETGLIRRGSRVPRMWEWKIDPALLSEFVEMAEIVAYT